MKCPHCNGNHPHDFKFCPVTGKEIQQELLACENEDCIDFGKHILPLDCRFCPRCGTEIRSEIRTSTARNLTFKIGNIEFEMIRIEGGAFWMGAQYKNKFGQNYDSKAYADEDPVHKVILSDYYLGKYPVTQALWYAVTGHNPSYFNENLFRPVENVTWNEIVNNFLPKLNGLLKNQLNNYMFLLPTEAQWEYAARGGNNSKNYRYSGSDDINDVAWYNKNSDEKTHRVGGKKSNELGIYDLSGNVREWCSDIYGAYSNESLTNPHGLDSGCSHVLRGGSWNHSPKICRVSHRYECDPDKTFESFGFRLALAL